MCVCPKTEDEEQLFQRNQNGTKIPARIYVKERILHVDIASKRYTLLRPETETQINKIRLA